MNTLNQYYSLQFKKISFILSLFILVIHGRYLEAEVMTAPFWLQTVIGNGICRVAVPTFFFISGFLFFFNINKFDWKTYLGKVSKRTKSLLIPYLLWNLIFVGYFFFLKFGGLQQYVNNDGMCDSLIELLKSGNWGGVLYRLYGGPINCVLWYVRDLFVFVLLSPVVYYVLKKGKIFLLVIISLAIWAMVDYSNTINGLIFFMIGGYVAYNDLLDKLQQLSSKFFLLSAIIYIGIAAITPINPYHEYCYLILHISGFLTIWHIYDLFGSKIKIPDSWLPYSFFIYCFHMPFYTIIKKIDVILLGDEWYMYCLYYLVNPVIAIVIIVYIGKFFHRFTPTVYNVLTGGR